MDFKDQIFTNVVRKELDGEIQEVGGKLSQILNKYAFFFENNPETLLEVLKKSYMENYDKPSNTFRLDFNYILESVPQESKDKLFQQIVDNLTKTMSVADIYSKEDKKSFNSTVTTDPDEVDELLDFD